MYAAEFTEYVGNLIRLPLLFAVLSITIRQSVRFGIHRAQGQNPSGSIHTCC